MEQVLVSYEVTEYQHDGHPDVAGQYSQGTFRTGQFVTDVDAWYAETVDGLTDEGQRFTRQDPKLTYEVTDDETDVTLTVSRVCSLDDHDDEDCECWEYVHSYGLSETGRRTTGADGARFATENGR